MAGKSLVPRVLAFLLVFAVLQLSWQASTGGAIEQILIHDGTVIPAVFFVNLLTPIVHARAVAFSVAAVGGGLNIENGCEGVEALFLLIAAMLMAPISWRARLSGILTGVGVVFLLNQIRILVLFYTYRANHALFDLLHGTVAPISVVLLILGFFYVWLDLAFRRMASTI